jgi:hypothetical protein
VQAVELGRRQIDQPGIVLIDEAAAFFRGGPILAGDPDRRLHARGLPLDHGERLARLRGHDRRHVALEDAGLLSRDQRDRVAQELGVVERHRRDNGGERALDHVGGIEPAAEAHFEQQHVGRVAREQQKRRRGLDLEHGDRLRPVDGLAFPQRPSEVIIGHQHAATLAAEPEALVETDEMRRGVDVDAQRRGFEDRAHERDGGALAVGAGDVDHRRQAPLGMIERLQDAPHAVERQVDQLRMKLQQAPNDGIDLAHDAPA